MSLDCKVTIRSENLDDYEQLKRSFCDLWNCHATSNTLDIVLRDECRPDIRDLINSHRNLCAIHCIEDLLKVLERRNALSMESPQILRTIALYCHDDTNSPNLKALEFKALKMIDKFMDEHRPSKLADRPARIELSYKSEYVNKDIQSQPQNQSALARPSQENEILDEIGIEQCLHYLCTNIGFEWTEFVRALPNLNEGKIERIRCRHRGDVKAIVHHCLKDSISGPQQCNRQTFINAAFKCGLKDVANGLMSC